MSGTKDLNSSSCSSHAADEEYIDMIDVLSFLWRAKIWIVTCMIIGIISSIVTMRWKKPPAYVTTIPATPEVVAALNQDMMAAKFNQFIERPDLKSAIPGLELVDGKSSLKLVASGSNLTLEVSRHSEDPNGDEALKLAEGVTLAAREFNKKIADTAKSGQGKQEAPTSGSDIQVEFAKVAQMQASEEAPVKAKLFALEARLAQKTGLKPSSSMVVNTSSGPGSSLGDDVLRLLGALEGKITQAERSAIITEYSGLVGQIRAIQAKYLQPINEMTTSMGSLSAGIIKSATGDLGEVPVVVADLAAFKASVAAGTHERYESKRALFVALGLILGGMLGLMAYGVRLFIAENRERIQRIFSK